jgi:hypothetical protein
VTDADEDLAAAVERAYRVFGRYRIGGDLVVCHCSSCMSEEVERELVATPLASIPSALLAEYTNSAHGYDDGRIADEFRYFLPRYLELIAAGEPPDHIGLDICLRRLGSARYRARWPAEEAEAIDAFLDAFLRASLPRLELERWPARWRLAFDMRDVLTMAVTAGADIDRLLRVWADAPDPPAAVHMAALRGSVIEQSDRTCLHSPYLEDHRAAADAIGAWLMQPAMSRRIEAAFFTVADARLQQILSDALPGHLA